MNNELSYIKDKIVSSKKVLDEQVKAMKKKEYGVEALMTADWEQLFMFISESLEEETLDVHEKVKVWSEKEVASKINQGGELSQSLRAVHFVRRVLWDHFKEELEQDAFSSSTIIKVSKAVSSILDEVTRHFSESYSRSIQQEAERKETRLAELSVPVVTIVEGVAVLPLIGEVDPPRARMVMDTSLRRSTELDLDELFIDVSGVPIIDTYVANYIYQIFHALELVGVKTTLTGLRPEMAKTMVDLGVNFKRIQTKGGLEQALSDLGIQRPSTSLET
ncbi:STAS domain-containing protein [Halobacillus litoralis]|uniref:STAS domain-containing protein n=1 Tax=Halobacillus litoralis TaxID=45668 RepID=UPI0013713188|nr:STAS domain-containing protein [Halobacillus litoralis]MYL36721.1 STAS domain-containing protein [Halobacillus litoralis]